MHIYVIPGQPTPYCKPKNSGKQLYDTQRMIKNKWSNLLEDQRQGQPFYQQTPLHLIARFFFEPPENLRPAKREALIGQPYLFKGNTDDLLKFIFHNCNSVLFDHYCTIYKVTMEKIYDLNERTEFQLIPIETSRHTTNFHL
jgi:hypothetical protein